MTTNEKIFKSITYRGLVLHHVCLMDTSINVYIAGHFCTDNRKQWDMQLLMLGDDRMPLNNKAQIFYYLTNEYDKKWVNSYVSPRPKQLKKPAYTLNQDMVYAIEQRNIFAHRTFDGGVHDKPQDKGSIRFLKLKNEIDTLDYSNADLDLLINTIETITRFISKKVFANTLAPST